MSFKKNLLVKGFSAILIIALLLPFALKFEHIFENHRHTVCKSKIEKHFHPLNNDCHYLNYNINFFNYKNNLVFEEIEDTYFSEKIYPCSVAYFSSQKATSFLRGPPSLF